MTQLSMLSDITVHCFFCCGHVVRGGTPEVAHAAMEVHYAEKHGQAVAAIVGGLR